MADVPRRYGVTVPIPGVPLHAHREWFEEIAALGFSDVWSSEADGPDGFTPLALATAWVPTLRGGIAIVPAFTRGPALLAQSAATMADAAPGRFALGVGASSPAIVERWNNIPFVDPFRRTRDTVRFLRRALTGEKVTERYDTFEVQGFRLGIVPEVQPTILVAALRPGMLRLAGEEADGAVINWLSAADVAQTKPYVGDNKEIVARIFVAPTDDFDVVRTMAARAITSYLNVEVYAKFHEWLGRGSVLQPMWDAWAAGDRDRVRELVPDEVIDELIVWGTPEQIRAKVEDYAANGVTTTAPSIMGRGDAVRDTIRALAPVRQS